MGYYEDYVKVASPAKKLKNDYPCTALKDVDKLLASSDKCKSQKEAQALQKKMDATFKKANAELKAAINRLDKSEFIEKSDKVLVGLKNLEKELLASEKQADKRVDDMLVQLPY